MKPEQLNSPACEIFRFGSPEELAQAAAKEWLEFLQVLALAGKEPTVALSGGRIAKVFFEAAQQIFRGHEELLKTVHFFWADERCVPAINPDSNYLLAFESLLGPAGIPETNIHRIPGELEPAQAAAVASRGLMKWGDVAGDGIPVLDLVILGLGEDGHVASLFPGEAQDSMDSPDLCRHIIASKPPPSRVTLGYGVLSKADAVWVLASGQGKEKALADSLASSGQTPLARVLQSRSNTRILTDIPS